MSDFETWWEREGQEFLYALNTTTDDDIKLVAEVAWKNGAYCAEQTEQEPVAWLENLTAPSVHAVTDLKYCSVAQHERGNHLKYVPVYAAPVRTKDLTKEDKLALWKKWNMTAAQIDAVIAKYKEKNK